MWGKNRGRVYVALFVGCVSRLHTTLGSCSAWPKVLYGPVIPTLVKQSRQVDQKFYIENLRLSWAKDIVSVLKTRSREMV